MSESKTVIIVLSAFIAAAVICLAAGLGIYFTAINLPASADGRGVRVLTGLVVLAVGAMNGFISGTALAVVLIKRFFGRKSREKADGEENSK